MPPPSSSSSSLYHFKTELPAPFSGDGTEDFTVWCRRLEVAVNADPHTHKVELATLLPARLSGNAFTFWDSLAPETKSDYDKVKSALSTVFVKHQSIQKFQTCINARPRLPNEPLEVFAAEITRLCIEAFPQYGDIALNSERFRRFVAGLAPYFQLKIHEQGLSTFDAAVQYAVQLERAHEASQISILPTASTTSPMPSYPPPIPSVGNPSVVSLPSTLSVNSIDSTLSRLLQKLDSRLDDLQFELSNRNHAPRSFSPRRSHSSYRSTSPSPPRDYPRRSNSPHPRSRDSYYDHHNSSNFPDSRSRPSQRDSRDYRDRRARSGGRDHHDRPASRDRYSRRDSRDRDTHFDSRERYERRSHSPHTFRGRSPSHSSSTHDNGRRSSSPSTRHVTFTPDSKLASSQNQVNSA